jgi:hypothetical protein
MIDYYLLNELFLELKRKNTSVDYKSFFESKLGKGYETFKTTRLLTDKIVEDGYAKRTPHGNYLIITPKGAEFDGYKEQIKKTKTKRKKLFLSHANADKKIAECIVNKILIDSLGLTKEEIFFTSKRETGIKSSLAWREQIKKHLLDCEIFVALITTNYHKSEMCHAELGAAWVTNKIIYSLYLSPITTKNFSVVVAERQADNLREKEELNSFMEQLTDDFKDNYDKDLNLNNRDLHIQKFQQSLRRYLRKNPNLFEEKNDSSSEEKEIKEEKFEQKNNSLSIELEELDHNMLKEKSKKEYPDDFSMQEHYIKSQTSAYNELKEIISSNKHILELEMIYKRARGEWKSDYEMVVHEIKEQLESLSRLNLKKTAHNK